MNNLAWNAGYKRITNPQPQRGLITRRNGFIHLWGSCMAAYSMQNYSWSGLFSGVSRTFWTVANSDTPIGYKVNPVLNSQLKYG
jgi:hypothetical protein